MLKQAVHSMASILDVKTPTQSEGRSSAQLSPYNNESPIFSDYLIVKRNSNCRFITKSSHLMLGVK